MLIVELVLKALARSKAFSLVFILNFALAIASLSYLQFFKQSIDSSLEAKSKSLLGADLVVSSRFAINDKQKQQIKNNLPQLKGYREGISTVSMVASKQRSRLMEIVKVGKGFPFYGGVVFNDGGRYPGDQKMPKADEAWVYQEVLDLLGLQKGQRLKIGKERFVITKVIKSDSLKNVSFSGFMPKIYLSQEGLQNTQLLQFGSTARYKLNFLFKQEIGNDKLEQIEESLEDRIDSSLRVLSPNDGRDRLLRVLGFLTNFLSLVSIVSFFLGLVGLIYLYSGYLRKHQKDITVLSDLGLGKKKLIATHLLHLLVLIAAASVLVFSLIGVTAHSIAPMVERYIDFDFDFSFDYLFFLKAGAILFVLSITVGLPLILPLLQRTKLSFFKTLLGFVPFIAFLLLVSHFVTPAKNIGLFFALALLGLIALFFVLGSFVLKRFDFSGHLNNLSLSLALKNITRQRATSLTLFTAIVLCTALFSLIPQVGSSLSNALQHSAQNKPRFFVIDAKAQQIPKLKDEVSKMGGRLENVAPMIRARIAKINDKAQEGQNSKSKDAAVNLSYRTKLKQSEQIIEGRPFSGTYEAKGFSKPVELSVEQRYAKRRGLEVGDHVVFDIMGLEVKTVVVNIRSVQWTEFVPNFFLIMQKGAIDDAPKTMLATISAGDYEGSQMLLSLTDTFPSLTVIDVKNVFETFANLVQSVSAITENMSLYSVMVGLVMSFIIIQYQMNLQKNNILRLKMIGITNSAVKNAFLIEYGLITLAASSLGIILGSAGSYIISATLFESYWDFRADILLLYFVLIPLLTVAIVSLFTSKVMGQKENVLFGE